MNPDWHEQKNKPLLHLNKRTIAHLNPFHMVMVRGGEVYVTEAPQTPACGNVGVGQPVETIDCNFDSKSCNTTCQPDTASDDGITPCRAGAGADTGDNTLQNNTVILRT